MIENSNRAYKKLISNHDWKKIANDCKRGIQDQKQQLAQQQKEWQESQSNIQQTCNRINAFNAMQIINLSSKEALSCSSDELKKMLEPKLEQIKRQYTRFGYHQSKHKLGEFSSNEKEIHGETGNASKEKQYWSKIDKKRSINCILLERNCQKSIESIDKNKTRVERHTDNKYENYKAAVVSRRGTLPRHTDDKKIRSSTNTDMQNLCRKYVIQQQLSTPTMANGKHHFQLYGHPL